MTSPLDRLTAALRDRYRLDRELGALRSRLCLGPPRALFSVAGYRAARNRAQYDVSPDGLRFLMIRDNTASQEVHVENGFAELLEKAKQ